MHIRFTQRINIAKWYGVEGEKLVPLIELCQIDTNQDYLLPADKERILVQEVIGQFGTTYKLKASSPDRGIRQIDTMNYQALTGYMEAQKIDSSRLGEPPAKSPPVTAVTEVPVEEIPEERGVGPDGTFELFPEVAGFLADIKKKAS